MQHSIFYNFLRYLLLFRLTGAINPAEEAHPYEWINQNTFFGAAPGFARFWWSMYTLNRYAPYFNVIVSKG